MILEMKKITSANDLPDEWDELAEGYYQLREFLIHAEKYNPCKQRYYVFYRKNSFVAGLVVYTLTLDLFTYSFIRCPFSMNIAGIPCSVSASGFIGNTELLVQVIELVKITEKGFLVILNLNSIPDIKDMMKGRTLPTIIFRNRFQSWDDYLESLRSDYRRRLKLITRPFKEIKTIQGDCSLYTEEMHRLYLEVLRHSKGKLETLSYSFFYNLPKRFLLTAYFDQDKLLGWYISVSYFRKYYFFLGGFDYDTVREYNTYFNLLLGVLKEGIERSSPIIDLGQTAEISKTRLGGKITEKWMLVHHSNWLVRKLLIAARYLLEYSQKFPETHVFKEKT